MEKVKHVFTDNLYERDLFIRSPIPFSEDFGGLVCNLRIIAKISKRNFIAAEGLYECQISPNSVTNSCRNRRLNNGILLDSFFVPVLAVAFNIVLFAPF